MQKRQRLLTSSSFRFTMQYMLLFGTSVILLFAFIYWLTAGFMERQTDATIDAEIQGLREQYSRLGLQGLISVIQERLNRDTTGTSVYLFASRNYRPLAGNLSNWPNVKQTQDNWFNFLLESHEDGRRKTHIARARAFSLFGGLHLLVGKDIHELVEMRQLIYRAFGWGLTLTLILAIAGGFIMSWGLFRRLDLINQTSREIMTGDLSRRIPSRHSDDEFDQLTDNLNTMLEQIETLMIGIQHVTDNIAHDLKTPLTRMRNRLDAMQRHLVEDQNPQELILQNIQEADQLLITFNALLRIARIESGSMHKHEPVNLATVITDAGEYYEALAQEKQQDFSVHIEADQCLINGDRDLLFQALINLLDNAIKHTPTKGSINLTLTRTINEDAITIAITDTGPGIPTDARQKVLQRFFRLEGARHTPGNGLGLSMVNAVINLHHAQMQFLDNQPGLKVVITFAAT